MIPNPSLFQLGFNSANFIWQLAGLLDIKLGMAWPFKVSSSSSPWGLVTILRQPLAANSLCLALNTVAEAALEY